MVHVLTTPAFVRVVVLGIITRTGIHNSNFHGPVRVIASMFAIEVLPVTVLESHWLALDLVALPGRGQRGVKGGKLTRSFRGTRNACSK